MKQSIHHYYIQFCLFTIRHFARHLGTSLDGLSDNEIIVSFSEYVYHERDIRRPRIERATVYTETLQ